MTPGFQHFIDPFGDITVADGMVAQLKTGVRIPVGSGDDFDPEIFTRREPWLRAVRQSPSGTFIGGSGLNLIASGLPAHLLSGPITPVGIFRRMTPWMWVCGSFVLTVDPATGHALLADATDTVATYAGTFAPGVSLASTTYGRATYNSGASFSLLFAQEFASPGTWPDLRVEVSAGTAQGGVFSSSDGVTWTSVDNSDWTVSISPDGTVSYLVLGVSVASRASGSSCDPTGRYDLAETAAADYNSGDDFTVWIGIVPHLPVPGFSYLKITESSGILSAVDGPFFAATLPASSGSVYYVPLTQCDGTAMEQFHTGLLLWPDAGGGGGFPGFGTDHSHAAYGDHTHSGTYWPVPSNATALAAVSGVNTGDQTLPTLTSLGAVPEGRKINGVDLSADRTLADLGISPATGIPLASVAFGTLGASLAAAGTPSAAADILNNGRRRFSVIEYDFLGAYLGTYGFSIAAIGSGSFATENPSADHPGVMGFYDSTTAYGGVRANTDVGAFVLGGSERCLFVFQVNSARSTQILQFGWQDQNTIQYAPNNALYLSIVGNGTAGVCTGKASKSGTVTNTATTFAAALNTWYAAEIIVASNAASATFSIYNSDGSTAWTSSTASNIPTAKTGWGIVAGESTTDAGVKMMMIDYFKSEIGRDLVR